MQYDFDKLIPRRGTNAVKWDATPPAGDGKDIIPLWVADMDFQVAPCILEALHKRVDHGIFGYTVVPDSYYEAVVRWFSRRHGWHIEKDWIQYTTAVVPALSAVIKALTEPGDKVVIQTPVYNCFFSSIRNNGCMVEDSPLVYADGTTVKIDLGPSGKVACNIAFLSEFAKIVPAADLVYGCRDQIYFAPKEPKPWEM